MVYHIRQLDYIFEIIYAFFLFVETWNEGNFSSQMCHGIFCMEEACSKPFNIFPGFKTSLDPQTTFCQNSCTGILHMQLMHEEQGCDATQLITTKNGMFY